MKWITREKVMVDRVACPWLIKKFVDKNAEFYFVAPDRVLKEAERLGAIPFDAPGVELGHHGKECSFEAVLKKYNLTGDPALVLLGRIVNGADTDNTLYNQPEGPGLKAVVLPSAGPSVTGRFWTSCAVMPVSPTKTRKPKPPPGLMALPTPPFAVSAGCRPYWPQQANSIVG